MSVPVVVHEISNMAIEDYLELSTNNPKIVKRTIFEDNARK